MKFKIHGKLRKGQYHKKWCWNDNDNYGFLLDWNEDDQTYKAYTGDMMAAGEITQPRLDEAIRTGDYSIYDEIPRK